MRRDYQIRRGASWLKVLACTLVLATAIPGKAAEERGVKSKVPPVYPEIAKRMKISGVVKVEATVDPDGKVISVKTVSGNRVLSEAAEGAVRKWKFVPAAGSDTVPVDVTFSPTAQGEAGRCSRRRA